MYTGISVKKGFAGCKVTHLPFYQENTPSKIPAFGLFRILIFSDW